MTDPRWQPALWEQGTDQRLFFRATFDDDPDAYDRTRPVCPSHVFDEVVELAQLPPGSEVLEIGPAWPSGLEGTSKSSITSPS